MPVDWRQADARAERGEQCDDELGAIAADQRDPITGAEAVRGEEVCEAVGVGVKSRETGRAEAIVDRDRVGFRGSILGAEHRRPGEGLWIGQSRLRLLVDGMYN